MTKVKNIFFFKILHDDRKTALLSVYLYSDKLIIHDVLIIKIKVIKNKNIDLST